MAGEDGARAAFWMRRELINVEVLSGGIEGPHLHSTPVPPLIDTCCQFGPRVILLMSAGLTQGCVRAVYFCAVWALLQQLCSVRLWVVVLCFLVCASIFAVMHCFIFSFTSSFSLPSIVCK